MKRLCIILFFCLFPFFIFAQDNETSKPYIYGYEDIEWGTSYEDVSKKYTNLRREWDASCQTGEKCYSANTGSVTRIFRFYNNKLYWVRVVYENLTQTQFEALGDKLIDKYGTFYYEMDPDDTIKFGYQWILFGDLVVNLTVNKSMNAFGAKLGEWVGVTYYSPSIYDEMSQAEIDNIEL